MRQATSVVGTYQTSRDVCLLAAVGSKADISRWSDLLRFLEAVSLTRQELSALALSQATHAD